MHRLLQPTHPHHILFFFSLAITNTPSSPHCPLHLVNLFHERHSSTANSNFTFRMSVAPLNCQGIRSVNISNLTPAPPTSAEIVYVNIYTDPKTKQECILWEDIQPAFYNALHVRHKARIVPFVKDSNLTTYVYSSNSFYLILHTLVHGGKLFVLTQQTQLQSY